jgi:glycosyltransferase involved in cell wall biosynthesis
MRILQISSPRQLGGGETHVIELTAALRKRGHEVHLAGRSGSAVKPTIQFPFLNALDLFTVLGLRKTLKRRQFDIIHAHVARDYPLVAAALWGLPGKLVFTRHLLHSVRSNPLYSRVDGWIAPTRQIRESLAPLAPRTVAVIPNWVDLERFPFQPHAPHSPIMLGLLGQISPHKGHDDAIAAVAKLGEGFRLLVAGKGSARYQKQLQKAARGLPVEFRGFVGLPDFFSAIDILLVPSWEEPFGLVLLEAMASGIPVIGTAAGGPLDILRSGEHGILVPPKHPDALADAVRSIESQRERLVHAARERVEAEFCIEKVTPRVEAFYRML